MLGAVDRLRHLVENYIGYSQLELFIRDPDKVASMQRKRLFEIKQVIEEAAYNKCALHGRADDISIEAEDATLCIDETFFVRALNEILDNALKFSKLQTSVTIHGVCKENFYSLTITDSGEGMSSETMESLGAFFQFDREKREQQGSGLGFHLAKAIIQIHGGQVLLSSVLGVQTSVTLILPMVNAGKL